ncbi:MAG: 50S ribosomal protein L29 [Myxococcota bacterium]|jgi:large subunit ribosomal protein L29
MKANEIRELSMDELIAKGNELRGEAFNVRIKRSTGQLENTAKAKQLRRDIARVETVLREKNREATK